MILLDKLKIVDYVDVHSNTYTYETYKEIILPIKENILSNKIKILRGNYGSDFVREYYPYTKSNAWGNNLDEFSLSLDSKMNCQLTYNKINSHSHFSFNTREFKFELTFKLPRRLLNLFKDYIESKFYDKCVRLREEELERIEKARIEEIGKQLLLELSKIK